MKPFIKYLLIVIGSNIGLLLLLVLPLLFADGEGVLGWLAIDFIVYLIALGVQVIVGIVFVAKEGRRQLGQVLIIVPCIILLIGFSMCSHM